MRLFVFDFQNITVNIQFKFDFLVVFLVFHLIGRFAFKRFLLELHALGMGIGFFKGRDDLFWHLPPPAKCRELLSLDSGFHKYSLGRDKCFNSNTLAAFLQRIVETNTSMIRISIDVPIRL